MAFAPDSALEQDLLDFLKELAQVQDDLLTVLTQKRKCLACGDLGAIRETQQHEERVLERLTACHSKRAELLAEAQSRGLASENLSDLAATIDRRQTPKLRTQVQEIQGRMRLLQSGTVTNWLLAQRTLLHISQLIEIIATGGKMQPTYVVGESIQSRGSLLNQEA